MKWYILKASIKLWYKNQQRKVQRCVGEQYIGRIFPKVLRIWFTSRRVLENLFCIQITVNGWLRRPDDFISIQKQKQTFLCSTVIFKVQEKQSPNLNADTFHFWNEQYSTCRSGLCCWKELYTMKLQKHSLWTVWQIELNATSSNAWCG